MSRSTNPERGPGETGVPFVRRAALLRWTPAFARMTRRKAGGSHAKRLARATLSGFTLLEALAALAIAAAGLAALAELTHQSFRAGVSAERRVALVSTTRKILAGLPERSSLPDADLSGFEDNHAWRISAAPYPMTLAGPNVSPWRAQLIALQVRGPGGEALEVETIRLRKRGTP